MTILRKQLFKSTFIASLTAGFTIWFGVTFEYDDYYQAALQFFSILYMSHKSLNTRKNEHEFQRKNRVAKAKFQNLLQKDPGLAEGLFADNVPLAVIRWFQKETGVDLFKVPKLEVVDSFSKVGDAPGNLIFRTGIVLGKLIGNWERSKKGSLEDYLSKGFEKFYQENKILLGEEISKGVFYKNLVFGNNRPIGIFLYHEECKCLVIEEKDESFKDSMVKISLCFKKSLFETIDENVWKEIKETILYPIFPYFHSKDGGSGPQSQRVPLFLTEKKLSEDERKEFPQKSILAYKKILEFLKSKGVVVKE